MSCRIPYIELQKFSRPEKDRLTNLHIQILKEAIASKAFRRLGDRLLTYKYRYKDAVDAVANINKKYKANVASIVKIGYTQYALRVNVIPLSNERQLNIFGEEPFVSTAQPTLVRKPQAEIPPKQDVKGVLPENISSRGSEFAKKLTNPYNNLRVTFRGKTFKNAEHAYFTWRSGQFNEKVYEEGNKYDRPGPPELRKYAEKSSEGVFELMIEILTAKLQQHPELVQGIDQRGGLAYIEQSTHNVIGNKYWESSGENRFLRALAEAYKIVKNQRAEAQPAQQPTKVKLFNANDKTLKKGSVVRYNGKLYLFWNKNAAGKAQLINTDGTKFPGTPNIDKLEVIGSYPTVIYNNIEYIVTDNNNIYSGATGNLVYAGSDNSSRVQKQMIIDKARKSITDKQVKSIEKPNSLFGLDINNQENLEFHINTLNVVSKFLENVGVEIRLIPEILSQYGSIVEGALATANFIEGTVDIIDDLDKGRAEAWDKLPEEAAHWWYRLLKENSPLKKALWEAHKTAERAKELYKGDYGKLKGINSPEDLTEEAIGQLIAEAIKRIETKNGSPSDYSFFKMFLEWIKSIIDIFKNTDIDPFEVAAMKILSSDMSDLMTWEEYRKLNNIVNFADVLTEQSVAPVDYTLIDDIGVVEPSDFYDNNGNLVSSGFFFRNFLVPSESSPTFKTMEELDLWVFQKYGDLLDKRQKRRIQEVRDNQIFFDRLLNKTFRKRSKFLPKTLRKYFYIVDAQNLDPLKGWDMSGELIQITKKLSDEEKEMLIKTNGYTNITPTLKVLPNLLQKYKKNPIVLSEPIKVDGAKKQELSILNGIREMIKSENPNLKSITAEEFVNEVHNWLEVNYSLGFAEFTDYSTYRQGNSVFAVRPYEIFHNDVAIFFNDTAHLNYGQRSRHFVRNDKNPSAFGTLTYFFTGKSEEKDAVLLHQIQNDNIEALKEFKVEKVDLETSLGRYLQQLNADLLNNITQIESGSKKIVKLNSVSEFLKTHSLLTGLLLELKDLPPEQGLSQLKERLMEKIELYKSSGSIRRIEKAKEDIDKAYSQRRIFRNFLKRGGIKSLLTEKDLQDLKDILKDLNKEKIVTETVWLPDDIQPNGDFVIRRDLKEKKRDFEIKTSELQTKINTKLKEMYGDNAPTISLIAPAKPLPKSQRNMRTVGFGVNRRRIGGASQEINENVNWLIAYSEKQILNDLSKKIEESKRDYIQVIKHNKAYNFSVALSKITLEQWTTLVENYKYNQELLDRLIDEQSKKDLESISTSKEQIKQQIEQLNNQIYEINDNNYSKELIKSIVKSEFLQDGDSTILKILSLIKVVLPIYETKYPDDSRVRDCLKAVEDYVNGRITVDELQEKKHAAFNAAYAADGARASYAAYVAYAAAYTAHIADAAYTADSAHAADAAAYAADAAAYATDFETKLKNTFYSEFGKYFVKINDNNFIIGKSKQDVSLKIDEYFNPEEQKNKQISKFEKLKQKALNKKAELEKKYGKIGEELKRTLEIELNYFTPHVHYLIQKHISQYGKDVPMYFSGYQITRLTQGNERTAWLYAGKEEIDIVDRENFEIDGKIYKRNIGGFDYLVQQHGAQSRITKEEYEKAYQQATERKATEIKIEVAKSLNLIDNDHKLSEKARTLISSVIAEKKEILSLSEEDFINKYLYFIIGEPSKKEVENAYKKLKEDINSLENILSNDSALSGSQILKVLSEFKKIPKDDPRSDSTTLSNADQVINTTMYISDNKPIETGAIYNAMSQVSGIKLIWQDRIEGLKKGVGGYLVDLSNYNYNVPILYSLKTSKLSSEQNTEELNRELNDYIENVIKNEVTYTDENGNLCAKAGIRNSKFTKGSEWEIVKDLGAPKFKKGGKWKLYE